MSMRRCGTRRWAAYPLLPLLQSRLRTGLSFSSFPTLVPLSQDPRKQPIHHPLNSQWQHLCRWPPDRWSLELIRQQWLPLHPFPDRISLVLFGQEPIAVGRNPESPSHGTRWQLMETPKNTEPDLFEGSTLTTPLEGGEALDELRKARSSTAAAASRLLNNLTIQDFKTIAWLKHLQVVWIMFLRGAVE